MLNRLVRDQWEYPRKMERHFPIKPSQLIGMTLIILNSYSGFLNQSEEPVCQRWNGGFLSTYFDRNKWTTSRCDPEYSGQKKPKLTIHLYSDRNFRNFWHNGKHPMQGRIQKIQKEGAESGTLTPPLPPKMNRTCSIQYCTRIHDAKKSNVLEDRIKKTFYKTIFKAKQQCQWQAKC